MGREELTTRGEADLDRRGRPRLAHGLDHDLRVVLGDERDRAPADALRLGPAARRLHPAQIAGITIFSS